MPDLRPLRFGIIGCGRVVQELHLPAWRTIDSAEPVALCDVQTAALDAVGRLLPRARQYTDVEAFLAEAADLDFVVLATPGSARASLMDPVLQRRLHLLCEKPLALDVGEARRLYAAAAREGVLLVPAHNYRYHSTSLRALRYLDRPATGDVVEVSVRFRSGSLFDERPAWRREERKHRTLLFDLALHFVDLALVFAGPAESIRFVDADTDDVGLQRIVFGTAHRRGGRGVFELTLDAGCASTAIEVMTERGGFVVDFFPDGFRPLPRRDTPLHRAAGDAARLVRFVGGRLRSRLPGGRPPRAASHARLFRAFVAAIQAGGDPPASRESVIATTALLDAVATRAYGEWRHASRSSRSETLA